MDKDFEESMYFIFQTTSVSGSFPVNIRTGPLEVDS